MLKYVLTLSLEIEDEETGETEQETETEYFDSLSDAEQAAKRYLTEGTAGETGTGETVRVVAADVEPEPKEIDFDY